MNWNPRQQGEPPIDAADQDPASPRSAGPHSEANAAKAQPSPAPWLQSSTAEAVVKGLTIWLVLKWVGKIIFAVAGLAFLAYFLSGR